MASMIMMRGNGTGGVQDALASIDVPQDGLLMSCTMSLDFAGDADGDNVEASVSFGSTSTSANDSRQVICVGVGSVQLTTSGTTQLGQNWNVTFANGIPVAAGERIFIHIIASASLTSSLTALLCFSFDESRAQMRRR